MDAREALRRYLEQRRDLGESELVLDTLSVEDAMRLLGAGAANSPTEARSTRVTAAEITAASSSDWRATLRDAGASVPDADAAIDAAATPANVPAAAAARPNARMGFNEPAGVVSVSIADVPRGLEVGARSPGDSDTAYQSLEEIASAIAACTRCSLYKTALNPVPGTGNPSADFMVVGEAPGANEDEQGVPFVGQAGQLLTKILEAIKLSRDDVFIANVLKHRPPGNRNPLPEEVAVCSPYLVRQIELVKPRVILALGTFASQTLLDTKLTIGKLRGQIHRYYGVPLIVTYHPAALLRNPSWKRPTWEDVQLARRILDSSSAQ